MALTTLDAKTALIVVDLQKGIVGSPFAHPIGGSPSPTTNATVSTQPSL